MTKLSPHSDCMGHLKANGSWVITMVGHGGSWVICQCDPRVMWVLGQSY